MSDRQSAPRRTAARAAADGAARRLADNRDGLAPRRQAVVGGAASVGWASFQRWGSRARVLSDN